MWTILFNQQHRNVKLQACFAGIFVKMLLHKKNVWVYGVTLISKCFCVSVSCCHNLTKVLGICLTGQSIFSIYYFNEVENEDFI